MSTTPARERYLDHNASAPLLPEAREALLRSLELGPGNPSSAHAAGRRLRSALECAREEIAELVGADPRQVVLTSGTTESNVLGVRGALGAHPGPGRGLVTTAAAHASLRQLADRLALEGVPVQEVGVSPTFRHDPDDIGRAARGAAVVALTLAESVTGTLQPVTESAARARAAGARVHVDAAQAVGRLPVSLASTGADLLAISSHKIGGPAGIGALIVANDVPIASPAGLGAQERGRRPGTESVALAAAFGAAARVVAARRDESARHTRDVLAPLRDYVDVAPGAAWCTPRDALPNTALITFAGCPGEAILAALDGRGIRVSTGSACASGARTAPHVLLAAGWTAARASEAVRVSVGWSTQREDVTALVGALRDVTATVRGAFAVADVGPEKSLPNP